MGPAGKNSTATSVKQTDTVEEKKRRREDEKGKASSATATKPANVPAVTVGGSDQARKVHSS